MVVFKGLNLCYSYLYGIIENKYSMRNYISEVEVFYKRTSIERKKISSSKDIYSVAFPFYDQFMDDHEEFKVLHLDRSLSVINIHHLSRGSISGTPVDLRLLMKNAIICNTVILVLLHNHPSGNLRPSRADINITSKIVDAAKLFDIKVIDHLILTRDDYYSFADNGDLNH